MGLRCQYGVDTSTGFYAAEGGLAAKAQHHFYLPAYVIGRPVHPPALQCAVLFLAAPDVAAAGRHYIS